MSCENKKASLDELIIDISKDIELNQKELGFDISNLTSIDSLKGIIDELTSQDLCKSPSNPVFSMEQLSEVGCDKDSSNELPNINVNLGDINTSANEKSHSCQDALNKANIILKAEQEEYSDLNILLQKLLEYQDNYKVLNEYYVERSKESARLLNLFQPILKEIRRLENLYQEVLAERSDILVQRNSASYFSAERSALTDTYNKLSLELNTISNEKSESENELSSVTSQEDIFSDTGFSSAVSSLFDTGTNYSSYFYYAVNNFLDAAGFSQIKNSIEQYSTCVKANSNLSYNVNTYIETPIIEFSIDFIGINFIKSQKDLYNEETGKRTNVDFNFKIKDNPRLLKNDYFNNTPGLNITNASFDKTFSGVLYEEYYNKLNDPINNLFSLNERGLTSTESLIDTNLKDKTFNKKREGSSEYYIQDQQKLESFYENFEINLANKKELIRNEKVKPAFSLVSLNLKKLARVDIKLLLMIGGANVNILDESNNLSTIVESISASQEDFITKITNLESEISRIKLRMKEIKPTSDRVKSLLIEFDSNCFSKENLEVSDSLLEKKAEDIKGNDPFGIDSLNETDPTMPTLLDLKYWLEFSKVLNKVALLPLPENPTTLRYWPVGLFFPTPAGTLIKIPLPIIWIPLIVIPSPTGVIVVFLTINGIFISPIMFTINATGTKQHLLTVRGPSKQFGYSGDSISDLLKIPLNIVAAKKSVLNKGLLSKLPENEKEEYEIKLEALEKKLSKAKPESYKYKRIQIKISDLKESVSGKSEDEKTVEALDKKESAEDAINKAKDSIKDKMNQLGEPEFLNSLNIQNEIENIRLQKRKEIDEVYKSDLSPKEKRKKLKTLRNELKKEGISKESKEEAIKKDVMEFFEKLKLPSIKIPADSTKLNPPPTPLSQLKESTEESISDYKNDPTADRNRIVKDMMKRELPSISDLININDIPVNSKNRIVISDSYLKIKDKLNQINEAIIDTLKGSVNLNTKQIETKIEELKKDISLEENKTAKRKLKTSLRKEESILNNYNKSEEFKKDNSLNKDKRKEISDVKFKFNAFKRLDEMLPTKVDFLPSKSDILPITQAGSLLKTYIDSLKLNDVKSIFGGADEITVSSIQDVYFNILNKEIPNDLIMKNETSAKDILKSSSGVLSSIAIPSKSINLLKPFTMSKKIPIDLNMLMGPLRKKIENDMQNLNGCLPVDIDNNFSNLNPTDIKVYLEDSILSKLDDLLSIISPIYAIISFLKSTKGINLSQSQISSFLKPPFGSLDFALFTADALIKINSPNSANMPSFNLEALQKAKSVIDEVVSPIMDNPASYIIPASTASIGLSDTLRVFHPVMKADDIPPWERLSSRNFLFVLFLDEFISEAAKKVGFFRSFI
jgi:hypothetical protein